MEAEEFSLLEAFGRLRRMWKWILLLSILGGLAGWGFHFLYPPIYEAQGALTISIDLDLQTANSLTQYREDLILNTAGAVIGSPQVIEATVLQAQAQGIPMDNATFKKMSSFERRQNAWELLVRASDPKTAAALANIWLAQAYDALDQDVQHARWARDLEASLANLQTCLKLKKTSALCQKTTVADLLAAQKTVQSQLTSEKQQSQAINAAVLVALSQEAVAPDQPVSYAGVLLMLGGAAIGFLLGVSLIFFWKLPL